MEDAELLECFLTLHEEHYFLNLPNTTATQVQALDLGSSPAAMQLLDTSETQRQRLMQTKKGCVCQKLKWFSKTKPTPSQNDPPTRDRVNKGRSHMFFVPQPKRLAC